MEEPEQDIKEKLAGERILFLTVLKGNGGRGQCSEGGGQCCGQWARHVHRTERLLFLHQLYKCKQQPALSGNWC